MRRLALGLALLLLLAPVAAAERWVSVADYAFGPSAQGAATWETVAWRWMGGMHGIEPEDGGAPWCEPRSNGTCSRVFTEPGDYAYRCPVHPEMRGVVTVRSTAGDPNAPLRALFTHVVVGQRVRVDASPSGESATVIESYRWTWGDGSRPSMGRVAEHEYAEPGYYSIQLRVRDEEGRTALSVVEVRADPVDPPITLFRHNVSALHAAFAAEPPQAAVASSAWSFGDGTRLSCDGGSCAPAERSWSTTPLLVEHTYRRGGVFEVNHSAVSANGTLRWHVRQVEIPSLERFSVETDGLTARLDASRLTTYGNATFAWRFGDVTHTSGARVEHRFPAPGIWSVELEVRDEAGAFTLAEQVALSGRPAVPAGATAAAGIVAPASDSPPGGEAREVPAPLPILVVVLAAVALRRYSTRWRM